MIHNKNTFLPLFGAAAIPRFAMVIVPVISIYASVKSQNLTLTS